MVVAVGMTVFLIAMLCVFGLAVWYVTKWNNKVPNSIVALHKKVLQLKIGSKINCSIYKACSIGLHKPFFLDA
jgi:hypothetical protein